VSETAKAFKLAFANPPFDQMKGNWRLSRVPVAFFALTLLACGCQSDKRQLHESGHAMPQRDINAVLRAHDKELMALPGVVGVYVGLLADQKTPCLRVMVVKKTKDLGRAIPRSLEGYKVEVDQTGVIRPMESD
jgi:hypothetical protein